MQQDASVMDLLAGFSPDPLQRPNARWRTTLRIAANLAFRPEFRETYIRGILGNNNVVNNVAQWQERDMYELAFTIIECATESPLPLNAGECYAVMVKMVCDSFCICFNEATKIQFISYFKWALNDVFAFYWGHCSTSFPFSVGRTRCNKPTAKRALALCDFIAALNPKGIISNAEIVPFFRAVCTNAITLHHLRAIDIMIGTAGSYLWLDPPDPIGNVEQFVSNFTGALAHLRPEYTDNPNLPEGVESTEDYIEYIVRKARRFAAYHEKNPPLLFNKVFLRSTIEVQYTE